MSNVLTSSLWTIVLNASPVVKMVLVILLAQSVSTWAIIFVKVTRYRSAKRKDDDFYNSFISSKDLNQIYTLALRAPESPMAGVFLSGYSGLQKLKENNTPSGGNHLNTWLETLERSLGKGVNQELGRLGNTLSFLATTGNSAPFIGLFGTVMGIMGSFHHIGLSGSASLATVAPGISEALIATAAGLAAAIPAVIAFNGFTSTMAGFEERLGGFADEFLNMVEIRLAGQKKQRADIDRREG